MNQTLFQTYFQLKALRQSDWLCCDFFYSKLCLQFDVFRMKLFKFLQNNLFYVSGITCHDSCIGKYWFRFVRLFVFGVISGNLCGLTTFCFKTARSVSDYVEAFFYIMFILDATLWYIIAILHRDTYAALIHELQALIETSKRTKK